MGFSREVQDLLDRMERKKPSAVMTLCGETPRRQKILGPGHYKCTCPFPGHTDRAVGSFDLNDEKLIAKCFACGMGGRPVRFYRDLNGLTSDYEAAILMAEGFGEITHEQAEKYLSSDRTSNIKVQSKKPYSEKKKHEESSEVSMQPIGVRSAFYTELVKNLTLNERDRKYLLKERGLHEADLSGFFSFEKERVRKAFETAQQTLGWEHEKYIGIPGVYESFTSESEAKNHQDPHLRFGRFDRAAGGRIGMVIRDYHGKIVGLQFRQYESKHTARYIWISSAFANSEKFPLFANGRSGNTPVDFEPAQGKVCQALGITEGKFKAIAMAHHGINTFSVQGVGVWKQALEEIENYCADHPEQMKKIWIAFDADQKRNPAVAQVLFNFHQGLVRLGYHVAILDWDESCGKGIDDVLANGYNKQIKAIKGETFVQKYIVPVMESVEAEKLRRRKKLLE